MVIILMGSKSDLSFAEAIKKVLDVFGVKSEYRIASAHKSVSHLWGILANDEGRLDPSVFIVVAGLSNALSGVVDANVVAPVISCAPYSEKFAGADIFSSLRMPSGVAPVTVLEPEAAALAAVKILAVADSSLRSRIERYQERLTRRIIRDDREVATLT